MFALNLPQEQLDRYVCVNLYSVLRHYYQQPSAKRKTDEESANGDSPPTKLAKIDDAVDITSQNNDEVMEGAVPDENKDDTTNASEETNDDAKQPKWVQDNERACELLRQNLDGLIIVAKEHPVSILNALLPFVKPSRPVVIFNTSRELLMETYMDLKSSGKVTGLHLSSNWMRMYQILPNRTHPDVNMGANSGFLLNGYTLN